MVDRRIVSLEGRAMATFKKRDVLSVIKMLVHELGEYVVAQLQENAVSSARWLGAFGKLEDVRTFGESDVAEDGVECAVQSA